jgi:kynureninase
MLGAAGLEIIGEIGVEAIHEKSVRQTTRLIELAQEAGLRVNSPLDPARRGGVVTIDIDRGEEIIAELQRREILVDYRPDAGIRISPHFYTADEELDHTIAEIVRLRGAASA